MCIQFLLYIAVLVVLLIIDSVDRSVLKYTHMVLKETRISYFCATPKIQRLMFVS